jgi:DNA-directed RNA polymerase delta subunit
MLKRKNKDRKFLDELHLLIITFLKKLSIFTENKEEMVQQKILEKLRPFLKTTNEELLEAVLRLLFNLSFDTSLRAAIASMDWVYYLSQHQYR